MVCPLKSDCNAVIYSEYSKFLGIPLEMLGMAYYGLIALGYGVFTFLPHLHTPSSAFAIFSLTVVALLFSIYLTFIQAVNIKQWCVWCLTSAGLCLMIFASSLLTHSFSLIDLLREHKQIILIGHVFGATLGVGGASITDVLFFKFLKDLRISKGESDVMHTISQVIWFALALLILTGLGLYLPEIAKYGASSKFLLKMFVVLVVLVNGTFLNLLISPKLVKISFGERHEHREGELHSTRKLAFALGAISLTSWYATFILGMLRQLPFGLSISQGFLVYFLVLAFAIITSQVAERKLSRIV